MCAIRASFAKQPFWYYKTRKSYKVHCLSLAHSHSQVDCDAMSYIVHIILYFIQVCDVAFHFVV